MARILVADDEAAVRAGLVAMCMAAGHRCAEAGTGVQALARAREDGPEVVLLDLRMPDGGGLDVLPALVALPHAPSVIVLTGYVDVRTAVRAMQEGAANVLALAAGVDGERVFYVTSEIGDGGPGRSNPPSKLVLKSVSLEGHDERSHLASEWASDFAISPDERWVAFRERFHVYLRPFARTGGLVEVGPESKDLPQARVTRDAGDFVHWSGDGQRLHWSLGPELFTRELKDTFAAFMKFKDELSYYKDDQNPGNYNAMNGLDSSGNQLPDGQRLWNVTKGSFGTLIELVQEN